MDSERARQLPELHKQRRIIPRTITSSPVTDIATFPTTIGQRRALDLVRKERADIATAQGGGVCTDAPNTCTQPGLELAATAATQRRWGAYRCTKHVH